MAPPTVIERLPGLVVTVTLSRMLIVVSTVWLSTLAKTPVSLPASDPAVYVEVAWPLVSVVLVGFTLLSSVPPKVTAVPLGTVNPPVPSLLCVRSAVSIEVAPGTIWVGSALMLSTSHGLKVAVEPLPLANTVSQPVAPGPALQPHQLLIAVTVLPPSEPSPVPPPEAELPTMRELEMVTGLSSAKIPPPTDVPAELPVKTEPVMVALSPLLSL